MFYKIRDHICQPKLLHPGKLSIAKDVEIKILRNKTKFKQFIFINTILKEALEGEFLSEDVNLI